MKDEIDSSTAKPFRIVKGKFYGGFKFVKEIAISRVTAEKSPYAKAFLFEGNLNGYFVLVSSGNVLDPLYTRAIEEREDGSYIVKGNLEKDRNYLAQLLVKNYNKIGPEITLVGDWLEDYLVSSIKFGSNDFDQSFFKICVISPLGNKFFCDLLNRNRWRISNMVDVS